MKSLKKKVVRFLKKIKHLLFKMCILIPATLYKLLPLKNEVFFYSIRKEDELTESLKLVYDALDTKKRFISKLLPHSTIKAAKFQYYLLTRKVIVTDDYLKYVRFYSLRDEQTLVQIWHAAGAFKKFGLDVKSNLRAESEKRTHMFYDIVAVSSENIREHYAAAFGIDKSKVQALGVARTDLLINMGERLKLQEEVYKERPDFKDKKIYLYCPTFRETQGLKPKDPDPQIDWEKFDSELQDDEVFLLRPHPVTKSQLVPDGLSHAEETWLPTTSLIACADVLITDYSSVVYDSVLAGVPIVLYCPDFHEYGRDFYLDFPDDIPALLIEDSDKLLSAIRETREHPAVQKTQEFWEDQLSACDGNSTQRIANAIKNALETTKEKK